MDTPDIVKTNTHAPHFIAGVALLLVGVIAGTFADPYLPIPFSNSKKNYQAGFDAARKLVEGSSLGNFFHTQSDVRSLSGTVTAIQGNRLTVHSLSTNPFDTPIISDRTIRIATSTTIYEFSGSVSGTPPQLSQSVPTAKTVVILAAATPTQLSSHIVSAASIQVGDSVLVIAADNIKTMTEFTASEIQIQQKAPAK